MSPLPRLVDRSAHHIPWACAHGYTLPSLARLDQSPTTVSIGRFKPATNNFHIRLT